MGAEVIIFRDKNNNLQTLGTCIVKIDGEYVFKSESLERGWLDNKQRVSCIPADEYELVFEYSDRFKRKLWEIKGVKGRSECKFHALNYSRDSEGCIGLGNARKDIDKDGLLDITSSVNTMKKFHHVLRWETKALLKIYDV